LIRSKNIGDTITLTVWRETGEVDITVTIADLNDMNEAAEKATSRSHSNGADSSRQLPGF
jgi:hypothetical protein